MQFIGFVIALLAILVIFYVYRYFVADLVDLRYQYRGDEAWQKLDIKDIGHSNNFTYSIWIYTQHWSPTTKEIPLVQRFAESIDDTSSSGSSGPSGPVIYHPAGGRQYGESGDLATGSTLLDEGKLRYSLSMGGRRMAYDGDIGLRPDLICRVKTMNGFGVSLIPPIPIQKWVNVITTVKDNVCDVYIDGKLYKSNPFSAATKMQDAGPIYILGKRTGLPSDILHGKISRLQYINKFISPRRAWDIYASGPLSSSFLSQFLNRYQLRIYWMVDNEAKYSAVL